MSVRIASGLHFKSDTMSYEITEIKLIYFFFLPWPWASWAADFKFLWAPQNF